MLNEPTSFNGKLIVEAYKQTEVKAEVKSGWATPNQKNGTKGLRLLVAARITDGLTVPINSTVHVKEEYLHSAIWAKNKLKSDSLSGEFIVVSLNDVEYISPPENGSE